jgi:hypothetical protein
MIDAKVSIWVQMVYLLLQQEVGLPVPVVATHLEELGG